MISRKTKNESQVTTKRAESNDKQNQSTKSVKTQGAKTETYHRETLEKILVVNTGWHYGEKRRRTAPTDKDVKENKDYMH